MQDLIKYKQAHLRWPNMVWPTFSSEPDGRASAA